MLSSKAKYALRASVYLAGRWREPEWVLASDIAQTESIPKKFLEAILVELRESGLIDSRRGRYGGHRLARAPSRIAAGDIIRVIDGPLALTPCASRRQFGACDDCVDPAICALRPMLQRARDSVAAVLDGCSLARLEREKRANSARNMRSPA